MTYFFGGTITHHRGTENDIAFFCSVPSRVSVPPSGMLWFPEKQWIKSQNRGNEQPRHGGRVCVFRVDSENFSAAHRLPLSL